MLFEIVTDEGSNDKSGSLQGKGSYKLDYSNKPIYRGFESKIKGTDNPIVLGTPASEEEVIPYETALFQNYPNPFNPITTIKCSLGIYIKMKFKIK